MTATPARRAVAVVGLVALAVIGYLLATGQLSPVEAGQRAALTLAAAVLVSRLAGWGFALMVASLEPSASLEPPRRRAADLPADQGVTEINVE